jgi:hypothetical protein
MALMNQLGKRYRQKKELFLPSWESESESERVTEEEERGAIG